jgi:hydrogenase/urease accessory protein HupE
LEARDIIALVIVVGAFIALITKSLSPEQAITVITAVLGYYFGYKQGLQAGLRGGAGAGE